jgi:hypothetical protein
VQIDEQNLLDALRRISWFTELPIGQLAELSRRGRLEHIGRYRTIIREGNPGKYFCARRPQSHAPRLPERPDLHCVDRLHAALLAPRAQMCFSRGRSTSPRL